MTVDTGLHTGPGLCDFLVAGAAQNERFDARHSHCAPCLGGMVGMPDQKYFPWRSTVDSMPMRSKLTSSHSSARARPKS